MITLEQLKLLEQKIEAAVQKISALTRDNASLQGMCDEFDRENTRLQEENKRLQGDLSDMTDELAVLKSSQSQYQSEREQLEQVVIHAIERLEAVETTVLETVVSKAEWENAPVPPTEPATHLSPPLSDVLGSEFESPRDAQVGEVDSPADEQYIPFGAPRPEDVERAAVEIATFTPEDSGVSKDAEPSDALDLF